MMKRRTAREKALQTLFQIDMNDLPPDQAIEHVMDQPVWDTYLNQLVNGVTNNKVSIDQKIEKNLENWTFNRLAGIEKAVLRIATYEIFYEEDVPESVAINEAVELAHLFGDEKSGKFVNGVLSKMIK